METKKETTLTGTLLRPLAVGTSALILHRGQLMRTSTVVAIQSIGASEIRFETRNTYYRLLPSPRPQARKAAQRFMAMAA